MKTKHFSRFSNASKYYTSGRPQYPKIFFNDLPNKIKEGSLVIDAGSGTGTSTKLLLELGYKVILVEPNKSMLENNICLNEATETICDTWENANIKTEEHIYAIFFFMSFHYMDPLVALKKAKTILCASKERIVYIVNYYLDQNDENSKKYHNWLSSLDKIKSKKPLIQDIVVDNINKHSESHKINIVKVSHNLTINELVQRCLSLPHIINQQYSESWLEHELMKLFKVDSQLDTVSLSYEMRNLHIRASDISL